VIAGDSIHSELRVCNEIQAAFPALGEEEREAALTLLKARAETTGMTLEKYMECFHPEGLAERDEGLPEEYRGYTRFLEDDARAVIRAGKSADFSTFVHESAHVFRRQLTGNLRKKAERAFGVERFGKWSVEQEEAFALGLEEYIRTKEIKDGRDEKVFRKGRAFVRRVYNGLDRIIDLTGEMRAVYDELFEADKVEIDGQEYEFNQKRYEGHIRDIARGDVKGTHVFLGVTPPIYEELGFERLPVMITREHLSNIMRDKNEYNPNWHGLSAAVLNQIPEKLKDPLCIVQSNNPPEDIVSVIEMEDKDGNQIVAPIAQNITINRDRLEIDVNLVKSVYGKDDFEHFLERAVKDDRLLYVNKKRNLTPLLANRLANADVRAGAQKASALTLTSITPGTNFPIGQDVSGFYIANIARYKEVVKSKREEKREILYQRSVKRKPAKPDAHIDIQPIKEANMENEWSENTEYEAGGGEPLYTAEEPEEPPRETDMERSTMEAEAGSAAEPEEEAWQSAAEKGIDLMYEYMRLNKDLDAGRQSLTACRVAVSEHWYMLKYVEPRFKTLEVCVNAVSQSGRALQFVEKGDLEKKELFEICQKAVRKTPEALRYVKDEFGFDDRDAADLCLEAASADVSALRYMKDEWKTKALYAHAVKENALALEFVKPEDRSHELCALAVEKNALALRFVPASFQTPDMCLAAVKNIGSALRFVREELKTPDLCLEAVKQRGSALEYAPEESQTAELRRIAVKQNGYNLRFAKSQTPDLCLEAVRQNGDALKYAREKTPDVCIEAVKRSPDALCHLFPKGTRRVDNTAREFEANVKTLIAEQGFTAKDAAKTLYACMEKGERELWKPFFEKKLTEENLPSFEKLFERWDAGREKPAVVREEKTLTEPDEAEAFLNTLGTKDFYKHPDNAVKEAYYVEHLKESRNKGYEQPVFSIGKADGEKGKLLSKLFGEDKRESPDNLLNPFSPDAVERMKEAAKAGVVFADEKRKEAQLAFMKEHLPEVYKIVMETLRRQEKEKPEPLVIGGAAAPEQTRVRKSTGCERGR
jgi:hypothetical protein